VRLHALKGSILADGNAVANWFSERLPIGRKTFAAITLVIACSAVAAMWAFSNAHAKTSGAIAEAVNADSLIISVEDMRRIANYEGLSEFEYADRRQPSQGNVNAPGPCRAVGSSDLTFAAGWKQFRAVTYSGTTDDIRPGGISPITEITHAVAVYPDARAARVALDQLESTLRDCVSLHDSAYDFDLDKSDPATLNLRSAEWNHVYHVKSSVLMSVGVLGIQPAEQVANAVLRTISDRIK